MEARVTYLLQGAEVKRSLLVAKQCFDTRTVLHGHARQSVTAGHKDDQRQKDSLQNTFVLRLLFFGQHIVMVSFFLERRRSLVSKCEIADG